MRTLIACRQYAEHWTVHLVQKDVENDCDTQPQLIILENIKSLHANAVHLTFVWKGLAWFWLLLFIIIYVTSKQQWEIFFSFFNKFRLFKTDGFRIKIKIQWIWFRVIFWLKSNNSLIRLIFLRFVNRIIINTIYKKPTLARSFYRFCESAAFFFS